MAIEPYIVLYKKRLWEHKTNVPCYCEKSDARNKFTVIFLSVFRPQRAENSDKLEVVVGCYGENVGQIQITTIRNGIYGV